MGLLMIAMGGLIVWAAHFALLYGAQTTFCTVAASDWSASDLRIGGLLLTAAAVAALLALAGRPRQRPQEGSRWEVGPDSARFLRRISVAGAGLALLAMLWATVPLLLLRACGPAAA